MPHSIMPAMQAVPGPAGVSATLAGEKVFTVWTGSCNVKNINIRTDRRRKCQATASTGLFGVVMRRLWYEPRILVLVIVCALAAGAPVRAASLGPEYYDHSKTRHPALPLPLSDPQDSKSNDSIPADSYLFLGRDNLFFNDTAAPVSGQNSNGGDVKKGPLIPETPSVAPTND